MYFNNSLKYECFWSCVTFDPFFLPLQIAKNVSEVRRCKDIDTFVTNRCFDGLFQLNMATKIENIVF